MKRWNKRPPALIPLICYGAAVVLWLMMSVGFLLGDAAARFGGRLAPHSIPLEQFEMISLEERDGGDWMATNADPQLIWINPDGRTVRSLTLTVRHTARIGEMALYYIERDGDPFGREQRVLPIDNGDGSFTFILPAAEVYALRLDPCSTAQLLQELAVQLNIDCPVSLYFTLSYKQLFALLLLPGLAASGVNILCTAWQRSGRKTKR